MDDEIVLKNITDKIKKDFDETSSFYKERYDDIYKQMLVCELWDFDKSLDKYTYGPLKYVDFCESLYLVSKFLGSLDKKFEESFLEDIKFRSILIDDDVNVGAFNYKDNKVYVNDSSTIVDSFVLVHEYIHKLSANLEKNGTVSDTFFEFAEAISILGEFLFRDFLIDLGYSDYDCKLFIDLRKECFNRELNSILNISPFFKLLEEDKSITKEGINRLKKDSLYNSKDIQNNLYVFSKVYPGIYYNYAFSTVVASDIYENSISNEQFVDLINSLNESTIEEYEEKINLSSSYVKKSDNLLKTLK